MIKIIVFIATSIAISLNAQATKKTLKNSNKKFSANRTILNTQQKHKNLQRVIKIEVLNSGDWTKFEENSLWRFVKINDGNLLQILNTENGILRISENTMNTQNWKDENGNFSFRSISEPYKISQEFVNAKNDKTGNRNLLVEKEIYETNPPIPSVSFLIYTYSKEKNVLNNNLAKTINIYSENQLIKTFTFRYDDLKQIGGISVDKFNVINGDLKK